MIRPAQLRDRMTIFRLEPTGEVDAFQDDVLEATQEEVACAIAPLDATEEEVNRETRINRYYALVGPEVEVDGIDEVAWAERWLEILGQPQLLSQRGQPHHLRLELREVKG